MRERGDAEIYPFPRYSQRRTVQIKGHTSPPPRRRPAATPRAFARPDRLALWAVLLGLFLIVMAVATAHAATP